MGEILLLHFIVLHLKLIRHGRFFATFLVLVHSSQHASCGRCAGSNGCGGRVGHVRVVWCGLAGHGGGSWRCLFLGFELEEGFVFVWVRVEKEDGSAGGL